MHWISDRSSTKLTAFEKLAKIVRIHQNHYVRDLLKLDGEYIIQIYKRKICLRLSPLCKFDHGTALYVRIRIFHLFFFLLVHALNLLYKITRNNVEMLWACIQRWSYALFRFIRMSILNSEYSWLTKTHFYYYYYLFGRHGVRCVCCPSCCVLFLTCVCEPEQRKKDDYDWVANAFTWHASYIYIISIYFVYFCCYARYILLVN